MTTATEIKSNQKNKILQITYASIITDDVAGRNE